MVSWDSADGRCRFTGAPDKYPEDTEGISTSEASWDQQPRCGGATEHGPHVLPRYLPCRIIDYDRVTAINVGIADRAVQYRVSIVLGDRAPAVRISNNYDSRLIGYVAKTVRLRDCAH